MKTQGGGLKRPVSQARGGEGHSGASQAKINKTARKQPQDSDDMAIREMQAVWQESLDWEMARKWRFKAQAQS